MRFELCRGPIAMAIAAAIGASTPVVVLADDDRDSSKGKYLAGDFHNHTTCSDGSISMQKLVKKSTDKTDSPGASTGSCRPATAATATATARWPKTRRWPRRPTRSSRTPAGTAWARARPGRTATRPCSPRATCPARAPNQNMWRWQSLQEFQYPLIEYLATLQEQAAVPGRRVRRRGPRAHVDVGDHRPDADARSTRASCRPRRRLHRARQRQRAGAVGVLLRPRRHRHQPRQHDGTAASATTGTARSRAA